MGHAVQLALFVQLVQSDGKLALFRTAGLYLFSLPFVPCSYGGSRPGRLRRRPLIHKKTFLDARMLCKNLKQHRNSSSPDDPSPEGERS